MFRKGLIRFAQIAESVEYVLDNISLPELKTADDIFEADRAAREMVLRQQKGNWMAFFDFLTDPAFWRNAGTVALAVFFFGVIIMSHEFGHFIFAKLFKVKVNEFAIGFGPTIWKKQGKEIKF